MASAGLPESARLAFQGRPGASLDELVPHCTIKRRPEDFVVDEINLEGERASEAITAAPEATLRAALDDLAEKLSAARPPTAEADASDGDDDAVLALLDEAAGAALRAFDGAAKEAVLRDAQAPPLTVAFPDNGDPGKLRRALERRYPWTRVRLESGAVEADLRLKPLATILSPDDVERLQRFGRTRGKATVNIQAPTDKDARRAVHSTLATAFRACDTKTLDGGRISARWRGGRKRRRDGPKVSLVVRCVLEKRNAEAFAVARIVSRNLGLPAGAFATAGVKDRRAVTYQFATVDLGKARDATACRVLSRALADGGGFRVDDATLWPLGVTEKALNPGRLRGNAFRLRVQCANDRDAGFQRFVKDSRCLNVFGPQRVGRDDMNDDVPPATWKIGRALLKGDPAEAFRIICASALGDFATNEQLRDVLQGIVDETFARAAAKRLASSLPRSSPARDVAQAYVRTGDVAKALKAAPHGARTMWIHAYQAFLFNRGAAAACREMNALPETLPLVGSTVEAPAADCPAGRAMRAQLREDGVDAEAFGRLGVRGATRAPVVAARDFSFARVADGFELAFELPSGAYATTLLRELFAEVVAETGFTSTALAEGV